MTELALTAVSSDKLRSLLRAVFKRQIECPLTPGGLAALGLQDVSEHLLSHMRGLDSTAVHAVLVAVIAEREVDEQTLLKRKLGL